MPIKGILGNWEFAYLLVDTQRGERIVVVEPQVDRPPSIMRTDHSG